jgi:hypothetical protein
VIRQRFRIFNLRASISSIVFVLLVALWGRSIRDNFGNCNRLRRLMMTEYTVVASCAVTSFVKVADTVVMVFALAAFGTLPFHEICAG